ncbi:MAG: four helix bundle protein [Planctomycetota bacterium]
MTPLHDVSGEIQDVRRANAHRPARSAYRQSTRLPREETFGLRQQTCRAATSIPTNTAEGCGRGSDADFARFLPMATGSASEFE